MDHARRVARRQLVDGLDLQLDPAEPRRAATGDDLDRPVLVSQDELAAVLTQDRQRAAVVVVAQPELRKELEDPHAIGIGVDGLAQQPVDLGLRDQRLGARDGRFRHRDSALEQVLDVVGRDAHRPPVLMSLWL